MTAFEEIAHISNIPIDVSIELARKVMSVREILALNPGSVIKLPRSAGDNIDILAGDTMIGSGEIVIIEDTVGVRITDFRDVD